MTDTTHIAEAMGDFAKEEPTVELQEKIRLLSEEAMRLHAEIHSLRMENLELRGRAEARQKVTFRRKVYWVEGDDVPHCPCCYEKSHLLMHLSGLVTYEGRQHYACPGCETKYVGDLQGDFGLWSDRRRR